MHTPVTVIAHSDTDTDRLPGQLHADFTTAITSSLPLTLSLSPRGEGTFG